MTLIRSVTTREGEAAERAVESYEKNVLQTGELQTAALGVIREQLESLLNLCSNERLDAKKIHLTLDTLRRYFDQLTDKAQVFIGSIQRAIDLHGFELDVFIAYKEKLIDYLERFIGEQEKGKGVVSLIYPQPLFLPSECGGDRRYLFVGCIPVAACSARWHP